MNTQEEIEREQGAVEIQTANLQELARMVLDFDKNRSAYTIKEYSKAYNGIINFAKGVAQ